MYIHLHDLDIFRLRVAVFYDENFKSLNGGSTTTSQTKVTAIFNHVQTLYTKLTVNGIAGAVVPEVHSINYKAGSYWTAGSSLR